MATRYLLVPSTDRALLRRVLGRADAIFGYPRTHAESEVTRNGAASLGVALASIVTEAAFAVFVHDNTGATILHGAIAVQINGISDLLSERVIDVDGTRKRLRTWIADQGWEIRADLPGAAAAWTRVAARDGAEGSADGRPIPPEEDPEPTALVAGGGTR